MNEILAVSAPGGQPLSLPTPQQALSPPNQSFPFPFGRFWHRSLAPTSHKGVWTSRGYSVGPYSIVFIEPDGVLCRANLEDIRSINIKLKHTRCTYNSMITRCISDPSCSAAYACSVRNIHDCSAALYFHYFHCFSHQLNRARQVHCNDSFQHLVLERLHT